MSAASVEAGAALSAFVDARVALGFEVLMRKRGVDPDPWVPHTSWPWPRRRARELAASGAIPGARKVGKDWLVRRSALDSYIESHPSPAAPPALSEAEPAQEEEVDALLRRRGFRRAGGRQ